MKVRSFWSPIAVAFALALASFTSIAAAQGRPSLISPERGGGEITAHADLRSKGVTRTRDVKPHTNVVADALDSLQRRPGKAVELELAFFTDATFVVHLDRVERPGKGVTNFYGRVDGDPLGSVIITKARGTIAINVFYLNKAYQVLFRGNARYIAQEIDRSTFQDDPAGDVEIPPQSMAPLADAPIAFDTAGTIDLLVVYSDVTRAAAGGTAAIENEIDLAVAATNSAYANSGVTQRIRLVGTAEVAYPLDTSGAPNIGSSGALGHLTSGTNGLSGVAALRNAYGADVVSFFVEYGGSACGVGWLMTTVNNSFAPSAFNVTVRSCATGNQTLAHEMGHNMGLHHDLYVAPQATNPTFAPYAHGFVDLARRFRTVMAYNDQCAATPPNTSCIRINGFSSPLFTYSGGLTGNASTADASRALNETALTVANFRTAVPTQGTIEMRFENQSVSEGVGTAQVAVARLGGSAGAVSVSYTTTDGSALAGTDYSSATGVLNWADGDTADKFVPVPITQNAVGEGSRSFTVTISSPGGGASLSLGDTTTVTINDDEPDVFPLGCTAPSGFSTTPGATTGWVVATDSTGEGSCSFKSNAIAAPGGACGTFNRAQTQFTGTFLAGTVAFKARVSSEGAYDCLRFAIDGTNQNIGSCPGNGGLGLVAPLNQTETGWQTFSIPITAGTHTLRWSYEVDCFVAGQNASWIDALVMPLDPTSVSTFNFAQPTTTVTEGAAANVNVAVNRTGPSTGAVTVMWVASNGSALLGTDFGVAGNTTTVRQGTLSWASGDSTPKNITIGLAAANVPIINDSTFDPDRDFTITLTSPTGGALVGGSDTNTVTIVDSESTIQFNGTTTSVGETGPATSLEIVRTGSTALSQQVRWTTANGSAMAGSDFGTSASTIQPTGLITFGVGETSKLLTIGPTGTGSLITVLNDAVIEPSETFLVNLTVATAGSGVVIGGSSQATVTINSEDAGVTMAAATRALNEGSGLQEILVNRAGPGVGAVDVNFTVNNGTAIRGTHFNSAANGTLHWDNGDTSQKSIAVTIVDNAAVNTSRTFTVTLSGAVGATLAAPMTTTVTIADDDSVVQFPTPTITTTEGLAGGNLTLTLARTGILTSPATVTFTTVDGTGLAGTDFGVLGNATPVTGTVTWLAGQGGNKTFPIAILNDSIVEGAKNFRVQLSNPVGTNLSIGTNSEVLVTLNDNDAGVRWEFANYEVTEGTASVSLKVQRIGPATTAASATWATVNGSALSGSDFGLSGNVAPRTGTVSWLAGDATAKTITIPIINDLLGSEGDEIFTVTLTPGAGLVLGSPGVATVTIHDNDIPAESAAEFSAPKYMVIEGTPNVQLTVNRVIVPGPDAGFARAASVSYSLQPGTALATSDYTVSAGTLSWIAGNSDPKIITIGIVNNTAPEPPEHFKVLLSGNTPGLGINTPEATVLIFDDDEAFPLDGVMPASMEVPVGATAGWHVSGDPGAYEGAFTLKNDAINDSETAEIQMDGTFAAGAVNFRVKVSTEANFDVLTFYVDGVAKQSWSGISVSGWQMATAVTLTPGPHVLKWVYQKDGSVSVGADAVYIDSLTTPSFTP